MEEIVELTADVSHRRGAALDRVMEPLADASERIVEAASGGIAVHRWHRRLTVAIEKLEKAREAVAEYQTARVLTEREALRMRAGIDEVILRLVDVWADAKLPDDIKEAMPSLREHIGRALH